MVCEGCELIKLAPVFVLYHYGVEPNYGHYNETMILLGRTVSLFGSTKHIETLHNVENLSTSICRCSTLYGDTTLSPVVDYDSCVVYLLKHCELILTSQRMKYSHAYSNVYRSIDKFLIWKGCIGYELYGNQEISTKYQDFCLW